tara:strand:+ start:9056 stop:9316 length:261 start_codon:yes stop_codon:yes gene_type:complete
MIAEIKDNVPLRAEGLDEAIIGSDYTDQRTVYSIELILEVLMVRDEMSVEEAVEFFDFNIGGAYVGPMTPIYVWTGDGDPMQWKKK